MDYSYLNQAGFDPAMSAAVAAADNSFYGDLVSLVYFMIHTFIPSGLYFLNLKEISMGKFKDKFSLFSLNKLKHL